MTASVPSACNSYLRGVVLGLSEDSVLRWLDRFYMRSEREIRLLSMHPIIRLIGVGRWTMLRALGK